MPPKPNMTGHLNIRLPAEVLDRLPLTRRSQWVREAIDAALDGAPQPTAEELAELRTMRAEIHRIGVNLNQVVRAMHASADGTSAPPSAGAVQAAAEAAGQVLDEADKILSRWKTGR